MKFKTYLGVLMTLGIFSQTSIVIYGAESILQWNAELKQKYKLEFEVERAEGRAEGRAEVERKAKFEKIQTVCDMLADDMDVNAIHKYVKIEKKKLRS